MKNLHNIISYWKSLKPLIHEAYRALDKEVTMGMPGPCMPAISESENVGIGSPYGKGAGRIWDFFGTELHKIQLGPGGRTNKIAGHSPYMSEQADNPFFIPPEDLVTQKLIKSETLMTIYAIPKKSDYINFDQVENDFNTILTEAYQTKKSKLPLPTFATQLAETYTHNCSYPYIGDLQVLIPAEIQKKYPDYFMKEMTLGAPPDAFSKEPQRWGFPIFRPELLFEKDGSLGLAGKLWQQLIETAIYRAKGGLRIDHFIAFVNPYVLSDNRKIKAGRLYSSSHHSILKKYNKKKLSDFAAITEKILLPAIQKYGLSTMDLYLEDIGIRPPQLDEVLDMFGLNRMLVTQFVDISDETHIYQLMNARYQDVAALDTHDTPSIQEFFDKMDDANRYMHALSMSQNLRFEYNDSLKSTEQLIRMKWAELMACPAKRIQAFFTSWTGQSGRYNIPNTLNSWHLRCVANFEELYFKNLVLGKAFNPLDATALAIFARGDDFYQAHKELVDKLRQAEERLLRLCRD
ncbi:MAG: 4-alpha-glucanotransferase [Alphaproteobacteria bacterium]|nr:4-alpha-glucanotransferase [Alphaproteobacteria bacterium]